ncbi:MAG TPA: hypothetical protein VFA52_03655 [Candidatus Paceibacterota bacterium]|nr:hypothetical protein [Candidatus Paceibacterota bacterium]
MSLSSKIKKNYFVPLLVIIGLVLFASVVYAAATQYVCPSRSGPDFSSQGHLKDCYRVNLNQSVTIAATTSPAAEWGVCAIVNNQTGVKDLFIPASTSAEWQRVWGTTTAQRAKPLPLGMFVSLCQNSGGAGGATCERDFGSGGGNSYFGGGGGQCQSPSCANNNAKTGEKQSISNQIDAVPSSVWGPNTKANAHKALNQSGGTVTTNGLTQNFDYDFSSEVDADSQPGHRSVVSSMSFGGPTTNNSPVPCP